MTKMGDGMPQLNDVQDASASPIPRLSVPSVAAPGVKGPTGTAPRQQFTRVNSGVPDVADAGAQAQKSLQPATPGMKTASEVTMNIAVRPTLQQLMQKAAMDGTASAASQRVEEEARRQVGSLEGVKQASADPNETINHARKLASAVEYIAKQANELDERAALVEQVNSPEFAQGLQRENRLLRGGGGGLSGALVGAGLGYGAGRLAGKPGLGTAIGTATGLVGGAGIGAYLGGRDTPEELAIIRQQAAAQLAEAQMQPKQASEVGPGVGPGALPVSASGGGASLPIDFGSSHIHQHPQPTLVPARPGDSPTQLQTTASGGLKDRLMNLFHKKTAGGYLGYRSNMDKLIASQKAKAEAEAISAAPADMPKAASYVRQYMAKVAEDAINPAHIQAGRYVPLATSEAGQSGPAAEDKSMVPSTAEGVAALTRRTAKAPMRADMRQYVNEPMQTASTDHTLQRAFSHTSEAGAKVASVDPSRVAASRAIIAKLAEAGSR